MGKIHHDKEANTYEADYVVLGCGLAGSVMASKLSDDYKYSVIAIEGGNNNITDVPIADSAYAGIQYGLANSYFPEYFWQQKPVPNGSLGTFCNKCGMKCDNDVSNCINGSCISKTPSETTTGDYTTGKILGGGTSINGQQYVRGTNALYDQWAAIGGSQWSASNALNIFKQIENYNGATSNPSAHGYTGPLDVRQTPVIPTTMAEKFATAVSNATGVPVLTDNDYNNPSTPFGSFTKWQLMQNPDTTRESSATAYLYPEAMDLCGHGVDGRRLLVLFKSYANKIIWHKKHHNSTPRAIGVRIIKNGISMDLYARKKIIVSLGIHSSEFLHRSGVGPKPLLESLHIPTTFENPNVGIKYVNQLLAPAVFSANPDDVGISEADPQSLYTGGAFLPSLIPEDDVAKRGYQLIGACPCPGTFLAMLIPLQPHSLGTVRAQSTDPFTVSLADNNYFGNPLDMKGFVAGFQTYIKNIAVSLAAIDPLYQLLEPSAEIIDDDEALQSYIIGCFNHTHHWMSSNIMAQSAADGVVDGYGNVFGVKDLVIVDNTIAPIMSDGNTSAPIYLLSNVIANKIIADR